MSIVNSYPPSTNPASFRPNITKREKCSKSSPKHVTSNSDDAWRHDIEDIANDLHGKIIPKEFISIFMNNDHYLFSSKNNETNSTRKNQNNNDEDSYNGGDGEDNDGDINNKAVRNTVDVVSDILNSDALQRAISSLLSRVIESKQFQAACQQLLKKLWNDLVNDPETLQQVVHLLNKAIQNPEIRKSVHRLILELINDEEIYQELTALLVRLGEEPEVCDATKALLTESAHRALNDPEILDHSMEFATDVVGDDVVQRTSGEALRNTVSYAVKPGLSAFLGFLSIGLMLFSFSALRNARSLSSSEKSEEYIVPIVSNFANHVGTPIVKSLSRMIQMPGQILSKIGSLFYNVLLRSPIQWIKFGSRKITRPITQSLQSGKEAIYASVMGVTIRTCKESIIWITSALTTTATSVVATTAYTMGTMFQVLTHRVILSTNFIVQTSKKSGLFISKYIFTVFKRKGDTFDNSPNNDPMSI